MSKLKNPLNKKIIIYRETRITSDNNINNLKKALLTVDWSALQSSSDVDSAYNLFLSKFLEIYNKELTAVNKTIRIYIYWKMQTLGYLWYPKIANISIKKVY